MLDQKSAKEHSENNRPAHKLVQLLHPGLPSASDACDLDFGADTARRTLFTPGRLAVARKF